MNQSAHQIANLLARSTSIPVPLIALVLVSAAAFGVYRYGQHCRACGYIECAEHLSAARPGRRR
jgi:hypothetical protein